MSTYQVRYRLKTYQIADALRPQPGWGYKGYTIESELIDCDDLAGVYGMAINCPPDDRYELFSVRKLPYCDENPIMFGPNADRFSRANHPASTDQSIEGK